MNFIYTYTLTESQLQLLDKLKQHNQIDNDWLELDSLDTAEASLANDLLDVGVIMIVKSETASYVGLTKLGLWTLYQQAKE